MFFLMEELATFGAGCFWGVEASFMELEGVKETACGYLGGTLANPTYKDVCTGKTGHAEVVQVKFDPNGITFDKLLDEFFQIHDPTTLNRQGPDFGEQYRSAIFYHSPEQKSAAEAAIARWQPRIPRPIVTEVTPASTFYVAEDYHQKYFERRGGPSCHMRMKW